MAEVCHQNTLYHEAGEELKAAQESIELLKQIEVVGKETVSQTLGQLRDGFVNNFRAQLVKAFDTGDFRYSDGSGWRDLDPRALEQVIQLISTFEAGGE